MQIQLTEATHAKQM